MSAVHDKPEEVAGRYRVDVAVANMNTDCGLVTALPTSRRNAVHDGPVILTPRARRVKDVDWTLYFSWLPRGSLHAVTRR